MKILFDQNMPWGLRKLLSRHRVHGAWKMGWAEVRNGELIAMAEQAGFDLFVTGDKNIRYQQNLSNRQIAILELPSIRWPFTIQSLALFVEAVESAFAGSYHVVECVPSDRRAAKISKQD